MAGVPQLHTTRRPISSPGRHRNMDLADLAVTARKRGNHCSSWLTWKKRCCNLGEFYIYIPLYTIFLVPKHHFGKFPLFKITIYTFNTPLKKWMAFDCLTRWFLSDTCWSMVYGWSNHLTTETVVIINSALQLKKGQVTIGREISHHPELSWMWIIYCTSTREGGYGYNNTACTLSPFVQIMYAHTITTYQNTPSTNKASTIANRVLLDSSTLNHPS